MLVVELSHQFVRFVETPVELAGKTLLDGLGSDGVPVSLVRPDEDDRHLARPGIVEPDLFRDERGPAPVERGRLSERPDLVVDLQELLDVARIDVKHEHFDGPALATDISMVLTG